MSDTDHRVADAARACLGVRFRPQGRDPAHGLDCVGLAALAIGAVRPLRTIPGGYRLRGGSAGPIIAVIDALGLVRESGLAGAGDLLLCEAGPMQFHLAISTGTSLIHADAGIGRVVERPGPAPWPVLGQWRVEQGEG